MGSCVANYSVKSYNESNLNTNRADSISRMGTRDYYFESLQRLRWFYTSWCSFYTKSNAYIANYSFKSHYESNLDNHMHILEALIWKITNKTHYKRHKCNRTASYFYRRISLATYIDLSPVKFGICRSRCYSSIT